MKIALVGAECEENLAIRYLDAALTSEGHETLIIPFNRENDTAFATQQIADFNADFTGLSMVFTYRAREFASLALESRKKGYSGHIVAGGHFAAFNAEELLRDVMAIDSVAIGEGESILAELARNLDGLAKVRGLVWRMPDGTVVRNSGSEKTADLDDLAYPTRKSPPDRYLGLPIANLLSSRGCTHSCYFCSISAWHGLCGGSRIRMRKPEAVAREMGELYRDGYRIFNFHDDNFLPGNTEASLKRMRILKGELEKRNVGRIAFAVKSRPDRVDTDLFSCMKDMGLFRVFVGIEAGTEVSLAQLGRRQTVEQNVRALEVLNSLDLHVCYNLLMFNPDSTLDDVAANVAFLRVHGCNPMNFCRTEVYSGTPLYDKLESEGRLKGGYWGYGYDMLDDRAQLAFELMHRIMFDRHHPEKNLHHLTMGVDYELKLAARFFGISRRLKDMSRQYVEQVNANTCEHLEALIDAAGSGFESELQKRRFIREMKIRVDTDSLALAVAGENLTQEIRDAANRHMQSSQWLKRAAAVGLITAAAASASGQQEFHTHMSEVIAVPPKELPEPEPEDKKGNKDVKEGEQKDGSKEYPLGDPAVIRSEFNQNMLTPLAMAIRPAQDIQVEIHVDKEGRIEFLEIHKGDVEISKDGVLSKEQQKEAKKHLAKLGSGKFKERKDATESLKKLGPAVVPLMKEAAESSKDPEVKMRCKDVLAEVDGILEFKDRKKVIHDLKQWVFHAENKKEKRFIMKVDGARLESIWQRYNSFNTHIFEMAPGPLD